MSAIMASDEEDLQQYLDSLNKEIEDGGDNMVIVSEEALGALVKATEAAEENADEEGEGLANAIEVEDEDGTFYINYYFKSNDDEKEAKSQTTAAATKTANKRELRKTSVAPPAAVVAAAPSKPTTATAPRRGRRKATVEAKLENPEDFVFVVNESEDVVRSSTSTAAAMDDEDLIDDPREIYEFDEHDDDDPDDALAPTGNADSDDNDLFRLPGNVVSLKQRKPRLSVPSSPATDEYRCEFCDYTAPKRYLLMRHRKVHTDERPYKCSVCERGFRTNSSLQNHVNTHLGKKPHSCVQCAKSFTTAGELVRHTRYKHTGEKPHKCNECDYSSVELSKLRRHMRCHTGERPYQCPHCTYASPDTFKLKRHMRTHTGEKPYECDICHARFTQSNSLKAHRLIHSVGDKPIFQCPLCPTTCGRKTDLRMHIQKLHHSEHSLTCKRCGKELPDRYSYKMHIKTHEGEKCYRCEVCPYASISMRHLETHMLIHTDEKPFGCHICGLAFRQQQLLKRHTNHYHNKAYVAPSPRDKTHSCPHCKRSFTHKGNLLRHMEVHDPECNTQAERLKLKLGRRSRITSDGTVVVSGLKSAQGDDTYNDADYDEEEEEEEDEEEVGEAEEEGEEAEEEYLPPDDEELMEEPEVEQDIPIVVPRPIKRNIVAPRKAAAAVATHTNAGQKNTKLAGRRGSKAISIKMDPDDEIITGDDNPQYMVVEVIECNEDEEVPDNDDEDNVEEDVDDDDFESDDDMKELSLAHSKSGVDNCFGFEDEDAFVPDNDTKQTIKLLHIMNDM